MHLANPFVAGPRLQNPQLFVGRKEELRAIISRMIGAQPTSVNIVGEPQIGKSSLLYYFSLTWQEIVQEPKKYVVNYIYLKKADCQREENFYEIVAQELLSCPAVEVKPILNELLRKTPLDRIGFSRAITEFENQGLLPVLCLDDFESLLKYPEEFDNGFYDNLRSLMDNNFLMLILASCETLNVYADRYRFVSRFFNVGHVIKLGEFTPDEAIELTQLYDITAQNKKPILNHNEQKYVYSWGKHHPYLLQLAASYLWEARYYSKGTKWAKKQFEAQKKLFEEQKKLFEEQKKKQSPHLPSLIEKEEGKEKNIFWLLKTLPRIIGEFVETLENVTKSIIGLVILTLLILVVLKVLPVETFIKYFRDLIGK